MTKTDFQLFKAYCVNSLVTVDQLVVNQTKYNYIKTRILHLICSNPNLTPQVIQWLFSKYPIYIIQFKIKQTTYYPIETLISHDNLTIEIFILIIDHLINHRKFNIYGQTLLDKMFNYKSFNGLMLNYLWERMPYIDITCEDSLGISPLFNIIINSSNLFEILQVIKLNEDDDYRTCISTNYPCAISRAKLDIVINDYARDSNQLTICALIGLCGELFSLIQIQYLTQDICNRFFSSKYFQGKAIRSDVDSNTNENSLIKLIPEQFQSNLRNLNLRGWKTKSALRDQNELIQ
jgi:hypothetical protein